MVIFSFWGCRDDSLPATAEFRLVDGTLLTTRVRLSRRARRMRLSLDVAGRLTLVVPAGTGRALLGQNLPHFQPWLERAWKKRGSGLPRPHLPPQIVLPLPGETFCVESANDPFPARHVAASARAATLLAVEGRRMLVLETPGLLRVFGAPDDAALCAHALRIWCRRKAAVLLPPYLEGLAVREGMTVTHTGIRDQSSRWGSCSRTKNAPSGRHQPSGRINLNWRALLLPVPLLEHLCLHELCHLLHMNHSPAYRAELARRSPHWTEKEKALTRAWQSLPWWALPVRA